MREEPPWRDSIVNIYFRVCQLYKLVAAGESWIGSIAKQLSAGCKFVPPLGSSSFVREEYGSIRMILRLILFPLFLLFYFDRSLTLIRWINDFHLHLKKIRLRNFYQQITHIRDNNEGERRGLIEKSQGIVNTGSCSERRSHVARRW